MFLLLGARPAAVAELTGAEGGKTAHYMLRWVSTRALTAAGRRSGPVERDGERDNRGVTAEL